MVGIVLLTISCSKDSILGDDSIIDPDDNGHTGTGDNVSLTMSIPLPGESTFTRSYAGTSKGSTYGEILIKNVRFVFYGNNNIVQDYWDLNIELNVDGSNNIEVTGNDVHNWFVHNQSIFIQTSAKTMERGHYHMLIIINPNSEIKRITEIDESISEIDKPFDTKDIYSTRIVNEGTPNAYEEPAYFLMLNSQGFIEIEPNNFYDTKEKAENNPVYASVERVAAKVGCEYVGPTTRSTSVAPYGRFVMLLDYNNQIIAPWGTDYDIPEDCVDCPVYGCNGKFNLKTKKCSVKPYIHTYDGLGLVADRVRYMVVTDLTWQVDIVNKKSFWLRDLTYKAGGVTEEKQGDTDRANFYAKDPNFSNFSGTGNLNDEFIHITSDALDPDATDSKARKLLPPSSYKYLKYWSWQEADSDPVYIPENTMEQNDQKGDVTTRVIFKAILKREKFGADGTDLNPADLEQIGDFFVFTGGNTNIEDYKYNNYNKDGSTFFILRPEDVVTYASATTTDNIHIYLRDGILDAIEQFNLDNPGFNWINIAANTEPAISKDLIFYKNGEIYYEVPIEHFSVSEAGGAGAYGRFGVVRNNWYKLNVENIISIGEPTLPLRTSELIEKANSGGTKSASDSIPLIRNQSIIF